MCNEAFPSLRSSVGSLLRTRQPSRNHASYAFEQSVTVYQQRDRLQRQTKEPTHPPSLIYEWASRHKERDTGNILYLVTLPTSQENRKVIMFYFPRPTLVLCNKCRNVRWDAQRRGHWESGAPESKGVGLVRFCLSCMLFYRPGASSDGGASVFSQRSAATKSSKVSEKSGATGGGASAIMKGLSGMTGIPHAAIEGSAFVVPAQEVRLPNAFF